jgi:hypothetical protein
MKIVDFPRQENVFPVRRHSGIRYLSPIAHETRMAKQTGMS